MGTSGMLYDVVMDDNYLGGNLRRMRRASGLSQTQLADEMRKAGRERWYQNTVSRIEQDKQPLNNAADIGALRDILGDVLDGTKLGEDMKRVSVGMQDNTIENELVQIDAAIAEIQLRFDKLRRLIEGRNGDD